MPSLLEDRSTPFDTVAADRSRQPTRPLRRVPIRLVAAGVGLAVLVPVAGEVRDWLSGGPLEQRVVDRSTQPLLLALEDLHEYHAASATLQVLIDREEDTPFVPSVISGQRVSFLATGTVNATVDFGDLDADHVTLAADGSSATIVLPAPRIQEAELDEANSRVVDRDRGVLDRLGSVLVENPSDDGALYALAERRLTAAATDSDLVDRAEANTRGMLTTLGQSLGVHDVDVRFEDAPGDAG